MKNIYFGVAIAAILSFSACSEDTEPDKSSSSSTPSSSSNSGPISRVNKSCFVIANPPQPPGFNFSLCWESETMTQEKCDKIADDYKAFVTSYEMKPSSPCPDSEDNCHPENGQGNVFRYNNGTSPIPMDCAVLLGRL